MTKAGLFLTSLLISLVGNSLADYSILWFAIDTYKPENLGFANDTVSIFFLGQALGVIVLAPVLATFYDRLTKRIGSICVDGVYALTLVVTIVAHANDFLGPTQILVVTIILKALSMLHLGSVVLAAVKKMSTQSTKHSLITNYVATVTLSNAAGAGIAGVAYKYFGFQNSLLIGIITFIPAIISYFFVFDGSEVKQTAKARNFFAEYKDGYSYLFRDRVITGMLLPIAIFNVVGALFPAMLGISLNNYSASSSDTFAIIIASGLILAIAFKNKLSKISQLVPINSIVPYSVVPCILLGIAGIWFNHPILFTLLYFLACFGSTFRNFATGQLRVDRIDSDKIGRVNSVYSMMMFSGQAIGGLIVIPLFRDNSEAAVIMIAIVCSIAAAISLYLLPNKKLSQLSGDAA